ncbi:MAG: T9SS type A sorting domain-containing protein, partial [Bacteroidales bacterium]|nr:T9SS type A sorting domain-containing protein [Bacteroidales bacterium]
IHGCDSIIVTNLTVNPVYADTVNAAVCSGDSYTFPDGTTQTNITADISESDTLATIHGCDSIIVTNLTVNPVYNLNRQYSVCSGDSYTFPDGTVVNNITSDTTHTSNLTTVHGCDSIVVINLTANPNYNIVDSIEKCIGGSYTFPDGTVVNNITSDTTHTSNLTTVHGCDSIITRTVVVVSAYDVTINANICDGDSYTFPDGTTQNNITANVTEIDTLTSSHGCDSIITTNVIVNPLYNLSENQSVCSGDSYTFPDGTTLNNITAGVVHVNNLASIYGCDSVITTNLSVNPIYSDTVNAEVCSGSSYTFPDGNIHSNIISDTLQTSTLTTVHGCDSIVVTNLSVNPVYNDTVSVGVCSGNNYTFPDGNIINNITTDTTYTSTLSSVNSCDSIIITVVSVNPVYSASDSVELCNGGNYTFPDGTVINNITSDTTQTSVVNTIHGCDSVITTTVMVVTAYNVTVNDELCSGDNYTFPDGTAQSITADITRIDTLTAAYGCDSIITTNLIVNPVYSSVDSIVICYASSYTFPDGNIINNITSDTTYASNLNTTHGCDSVITITISPITEFNVSQNVTVCSGDDHTFPDGSTINNITTDTTHVSILTTTQGCDSIITTMVSVNPSFNLSETASVCSGGSYVFADGDTISNITTDTTHVSNLQTIHGCDSVITTTVHANPVYNMSETMNICCGDDCTFPDGVTVHHVSEPMIHVSNMTTVNSCDSVIQTIVNVHSVDTAVIQTDTSLIAHAENAVYQWVNCDSNYAHISGANFRAFRITQAGNYAVIIIQDQCADTSACVQVASVGIYDNKSANIRIYPNPSDGKITIEGLNPDVWGIVKIWNTVGEIILQEKVKQQSLIIDLNGEPRGTYLIQIIYDNNVYSTKILLI